MSSKQARRPATCPSWCEMGHGVNLGEEDLVHVSGQLCVRNTLIRLCSSVDPETGEQDGPYVLLGPNEYTLDEVDDLVTALTSLSDQARAGQMRVPTPRAGA